MRAGVHSALFAFALNVLIATAGTLLLDAARVPRGRDETVTPDYLDEEGPPVISTVAAG
jgi:hypothetical protein